MALNIYFELFSCKELQSLEHFVALQCRIGGDTFQGQMSFFPDWKLVCFIVNLI